MPHKTLWASCPGGMGTCWGQLWDSLVPSPSRPTRRNRDGPSLSFRAGDARMRTQREVMITA